MSTPTTTDDVLDLPEGAQLPVAIAAPDGPGHRQVVTYLDTAEDDLRRAGARLWRTQTTDASGWTLRLPDGTQLTRPDSATVPREMAEVVRGVRRGRRLATVARMTVDVQPWTAPDGVSVVVDTVSGAAAGATLGQWRRVRVGGTDDDRAAVVRALTRKKVGARPSPDDLERVRPLPVAPAPGRGARAGDLVAAYVREQIDAILTGDLLLRRATVAADIAPGDELIHRTRVATRRLRSTLRIFAAFLDPGPAEALDAELAWYAAALGEVRDRDVQLAHLTDQVAELPEADVLGPVSARITTTLTAERSAARTRLDRVLRGARYRGLLDELARWQIAPPATARADRPARALRAPVGRATRKLDRRLGRGLAGGADHDEHLHAARKAAKRLRYAVELAGPVLDGAQRRQGRRAKKVQTVLGEHQDAVVAAALLRRLGSATARVPTENGFTFGVLHARELHRADAARVRARSLR